MKKNIVILGAGSMGTAVAIVAAQQKNQITLWARESEVVDDINTNHINSRFLPGFTLADNIRATSDLASALSNAQLIILAVPSPVIRLVCQQTKEYLNNKVIIVNTAKGVEEKTGLRMSEVIHEVTGLPFSNISTLSGPSIANEIAAGIPTAVAVASLSVSTRNVVVQSLENKNFKVYVTADLVGIEILGTMKNIYAIAAGICDAQNLSMNAKSFLLTIALHEMRDLLIKLGGRAETVTSVAGIGDLIVTALSEHGRNRSLGERICTSDHCDYRLERHQTETLEGVTATKIILKLAKKYHCELPLARMVGRVLFERKDPCTEINRFFTSFKFK